MPNKTLYVRDEDAAVWDRADQAAAGTGQSVSQLVATALREYLPSIESRLDAMQEIRVRVGDRVPPVHGHQGSPEDYQRAEAFTGRWLVPPGDQARSRITTGTTGYCYAVALTRRGQIAVWRYHPRALREATLEAAPALRDADLPDDIRERAAAALGASDVRWRDI